MAISNIAKRLLWARSGGYCQNPGCKRDFFVFFQDGKVSNIEELAHMIGHSEKGPRGKHKCSEAEKDQYNNIILLCPTCHELVDKNPMQFPVAMLYDWKNRHEEAIRNVFVVPVFKDRQDLAKSVHGLLRNNRTIFQQYGPHSSYATDPLSDAANVWKRHVLLDIIPNNRKIVNLLNANEHLLSEAEHEVFGAFVMHQQEFEYNHISGDKTASAPLFPEQMNNFLRG